GVHRLPWRCVSLVEVKRIFLALVVASAAMAAVRLISPSLSSQLPGLAYLQVPLGVLAIDFALSFLGACGVRAAYRLLMDWRYHRRRDIGRGRRARTLLVGTGRAGVRVAGELIAQPGCGMELLGFIGEERGKFGMLIHGLPVLGT